MQPNARLAWQNFIMQKVGVTLTQDEEPHLAMVGHAGMQGCKDTNFPISLYTNICRNIDMYITYTPKEKKKMVDGIACGRGGAKWAKF
jgi:hypothetical protein